MPYTTATEAMKELLRTRAEIDERIKVERRRLTGLNALRRFLAKRPQITRSDLLAMAREMKARRGKLPVASKHTSTLAAPPAGVLGKALFKAREAKGITRTDFARKVGCHNSNIGYWERGTGKPGPDFRPKISKLLGIDVEALIASEAKANGHAAHG